MIDNKELPSEYLSVRQVWLMQLNRCNEAISNRAKPDASENTEYAQVGNRTVVYSVKSLYLSLVDYGEAKIKTDCMKIYKEQIKLKSDRSKTWSASADAYQIFFESIIKVLNRYGMLFDSQPSGYTNVKMKSV